MYRSDLFYEREYDIIYFINKVPDEVAIGHLFCYLAYD